jgi:potassium efflux system protein
MNQFLLKLFFLFFISTLNFAASSPQIETITPEFIQSKIDALNARQGLEESVKSNVLKQYQAAIDNLTSNAQSLDQIADFNDALHQAPTQTKTLQQDIEQLISKVSKQIPEDFSRLPVEELEQRLIIEKGKVSQFDTQLKKVEADLALQNSRATQIREETLQAQQLIEEARQKLELSAAPSDSKLEYEARQLYLKTLIQSQLTELKELDTEAISQPARIDLLKTQSKLLDIQKNALIPIVAIVENLAFELRSKEAKKMRDDLSQSEKELEGKHELIQQHTRDNLQYSLDLQEVTEKIEQTSEQKSQTETKTAEIEGEFKSADKKIRLANLSPAFGKMLREQRRSLVSKKDINAQSKKLQNEIALTSLNQFQVENREKELMNVDDALDNIMVLQIDQQLPFDQRMRIQAQLRVLFNTQKELLKKLASADTTYLRTLGDLDFTRQQLLVQAEKFAAYLDERLLWVPSSEPLNLGVLTGIFQTLQWIFLPKNWLEFMQDSGRIFWQNPLPLSLSGLLFFAFLQLKKWLSEHLQLVESQLRHSHTDHFFFTLRVLLNHVVQAALVPILLFFLGSFLTRFSFVDFNLAIGMGLQKLSLSLFILGFCLRFFTIEGVARRHFQWQKSTILLLRNQFLWLRFIVLPAIFLIHVTNNAKMAEYGDSLGRVALISMLLAIAVFMARLLNPRSGLWEAWKKYTSIQWLISLRYVIFAVVLVVPIVIIGFAVMGYYLSALELQEKLIATLRLLIITILVHEILLRWLTLTNRKLAVKNALESTESEDEQLDIPKINAQTRKLLHVTLTISAVLGFWLIWQNILPAFSFLEKVVLWQHKVIIENQETYEPITLTNLFLSGLYLFLAIITVRNFSGLLELFVFTRWEVEAGSRYAVNQLTKYFLITLAFIVISSELGGSWSQVQFLVAALGVGLGFGLQEIFANLVSGIILLFERPIRVGDIVTIGDVTGRVSRIQMRATTLIDWDQYEVIVPNKTFITSRLTNWTLSDSTTRIVISLGIAYDSDVKFAHELILKTVKETLLILSDPEPSVFFMEFGDSALMFSIRFFVSETAHRLPATHDLNVRLEQVLRENKIIVPFPQHDVHIIS